MLEHNPDSGTTFHSQFIRLLQIKQTRLKSWALRQTDKGKKAEKEAAFALPDQNKSNAIFKKNDIIDKSSPKINITVSK